MKRALKRILRAAWRRTEVIRGPIFARAGSSVRRSLSAALADLRMPIEDLAAEVVRLQAEVVELREARDARRARRMSPGPRRLTIHTAHRPRPRIAFFSPLPPLLSGISDYSIRLIEALQAHYTIDVYHDEGYIPGAKLRSPGFACRDHRLFRRHHAIRGYHAVVYQMGNSPLHKYLYELLPEFPGLVTLHDFNLANFRYWDCMVNGRGMEAFRDELAAFRPEALARYGKSLKRWARVPEGVSLACAREGLYLNQRIFAQATGVVFHSPWCVAKTHELHPDYAGRLTVIPYGATAQPPTPASRAEIRDRHGLPREALIVGNFGLIHSTKMNVESLRAFAAVAGRDASALFILVGPEYDDGEARACAAALGLQDRVRFLGSKPAGEFVETVAAADIGLNLRRPPTNGETSSSLLDLLRQGIPSIITDVGTFADFPAHAVRKIPWADATSQDRLTSTLADLAASPQARERLGASALAHVREQHDWSRVAELYAGAIEASIQRPRLVPPMAQPEFPR